MEGGSAAATEILLQNLTYTLKEISWIRGMNVHTEQMLSTLETIRGFLNDAERKYINQHAVRHWLEDLDGVLLYADNVLNELEYHILREKVKDKKTMTEKVLLCFSSFNNTVRLWILARKIKKINSSLDSINKRATDLHLQIMFMDAPAAVPVAAFETNSFTAGPIFIGRDNDVPKLVEVMTRSADKPFSVIVVQGMGGMGKTTLTRKVFNHQKIDTRFECRSWVYVSQTFHLPTIFKKFLASLPPQTDESSSSSEAISLKHKKSFKAENDEIQTTEGILKKLRDALKDKTYLLVLDDVWNEDRIKWIDFINSLLAVTSTMGNGIIITTRSLNVASVVNPLQTHRLYGLSDDDCWSIIKVKALHGGNVFPSEFEAIGRKIARRCQGLPLAANVVGRVLHGKSAEDWISIEQNLDKEDSISGLLKLSYDNLSSASLKMCFAYCSVFPKGHNMAKQELIELWMAEGFLQPDGEYDMESLGEKFVYVLVSNSLLQVVTRNEDEDEIFVMHNFTHDLAASVLGSIKLRFMRHGDESREIPEITKKYTRTLFIEGKCPEINLSDFKSLHVLRFDGRVDGVEKLLFNSFGKMMHLRNLNISGTRIKYLPDSIGKLHRLQTLRAEINNLRLPPKLKYLTSLRHLHISDDVKLPPQIGRLTSLRTLSHFTVGHENGCTIEELRSLENLRKLKICNLEMVQGKEEAEKANMLQKPVLSELRLEWDYRREEGEINDEDVLEGLQPHPNLRKLEIHYFRGKRFPLWNVKMEVRDEPRGSWLALRKLTEIMLAYCTECEEIPMLGHLPNLRHLYLRRLSNVKSINWIENTGVCEGTTVLFPVLERLELCYMDHLSEWGDSLPHEVNIFPRLQYLKIHSSPQLTKTPIHAFPCLKELNLQWLDQLKCLPESFFCSNQNLSKLIISQCPNLSELPDGLHTLSSLKELTIRDCPNLKSIGNASGSTVESQGSLSRLWIENCDALMDLPHDIVNSWALSLKIVSLLSLNSLKNLPEVMECISKSAHLRELSIVGVPKFMTTCSVERWPFERLQKLKIDGSVQWSGENNIAIGGTIDGILGGCSRSLVELQLKGMGNRESMPESIQNLTGLSWLRLNNFGIEELPEWLSKLPSLKILSLCRCKKLRRLGGTDALNCITKLERMLIDDCPKLSIDSEWRRNNFPHLDIRVNGRVIS